MDKCFENADDAEDMLEWIDAIYSMTDESPPWPVLLLSLIATQELAEYNSQQKKKGPSARSLENDKLKFMVRTLFSLDRDKALTIADVREIPMVREWQGQQGLSEDRLTRVISDAAPNYARGSRGRPNDSEWENNEIMLYIPSTKK